MYFHKRWFLKPVLLGMIFLLLIGGPIQSNAQTPVSQTDPPFTTIPLPEDAHGWSPKLSPQDIGITKNQKLDSVLSQLAAAGDSTSRTSIIETQSLRMSDGRVQVQISTSSEDLGGAMDAVNQAGGLVTKSSKDGTLFQAWLPVDAVESVAEIDSIHYIRRPDQIMPLDELNAGTLTTEGLTAINGNAWHTAGYQGGGIKVGIIDTGFDGYNGLLGVDLPVSVVAKNFVDGETDPQVDGTSKHGTACAEIIYDIAPGASLYIAKVGTLLDMEEAVTWLRDVQNVDIISTSLVLYNVSPGDGTGFLEDLVSDAWDAGIIWVTGAGNDREVHWGGPYFDPENDNSHNYNETADINYFIPEPGYISLFNSGSRIPVYLRWDDWTSLDQDYDLALYRNIYSGGSFQGWTLVATSTNVQDGTPGQLPTESIYYTTEVDSAAYGFVIFRENSNRAVNFEIFTPKTTMLKFSLYSRSLANLADAASAVTVAALDVTSPYDQEPYSSQGPTNGPGGIEADGFTKPDIAGFANVSTVSYGTTNKFNGTSSATPHVAGAAALVLSAYPAFTPDQLQTFLEDRAVDMGTSGMDNIYGHGRLNLGTPPTDTTGPVVTGITPETGENTGVVSVSISGSNFETGATVKLSKAGETDISGGSVTVPTANQINCSFDLTGAASGLWNVVVTNPDTQSGTLTNGFTVTSSTPTEWMSYLPLILKPLNPPTLNEISNTDGDGSYTVSWSSISGATSYTLQEDDNAAFSSPTTIYEGASTSKAISGKDVGTYYYRVKAAAGSMSSGWSNIRSVVVTAGLPENIYFMVGDENTTYYIYSSGRSFSVTSQMDYPVTQVSALSWLASTKLVTFTISIKHNGSTVATWTQSVNSNVWTLYEHTKNVSFNIQAGDTLTYYISSNQYGEGAFLHGGGYAIFYK